MSLKTALLPGKTVAAFDADIVAALKLKTADPKAISQERMQLGIRNEAGDIYRAIGVTGMTAWMGAIESMLSLGFADELADAINPKHGCDAIFSRPV